MINTLRSNEVFKASDYVDRKIVIVGMGAIGSHALEQLACTGLTNIHCADYDKVEDHNLGNQLYVRNDIGQKKVDACQAWVLEKCGEDTASKMGFHDLKVQNDGDGHQLFQDAIVLCCVDTFKARQEMQETASVAGADMFIEAGMATGHFTQFMFNPMVPRDIRLWLSTLGDDDDPAYETSACGSSLSVGVTATLAGCVMARSTMSYLKTGYVEKKLRMETEPFLVSRIDQR